MDASMMIIFDCIGFGLMAGVIYGIFGGGSGLILTPGFYYLLRHFSMTSSHQMQTAIASTAASTLVLAIVASRVQIKTANVDYHVVKKLIKGLFVGAIVAILLINIFPSQLLKTLFGCVVILVAFWLWFYQQERDLRLWSLDTPFNHVACFFIGLLWFLLGIAVFTVPYLHKNGMPIRNAVGVATFVGTIMVTLATVLFMVSGSYTVGISASHIGYVNLVLVLVATLPSALAAYLGSKLSHRLPTDFLKNAYASLTLVVGVLMLL